MIDYKKLQEAAKIIEKHYDKASCEWNIHSDHDYIHGTIWTKSHEEENQNEYSFSSIQECINKLRKLTQPEPRYKVGNKVWVRDYEFGPVETMICEIDTASKEMYYENEYQEWREEKEIYPSREALIESQIKYWQGLAEESKKYYQGFGYNGGSGKCEHKSDGHSFSHDGGVTETHKCKKCGEFYR